MSSVVIAGDTSGTVTISAPAVAGTPTLTLPTTSGTILTTTGGVTPGTSGNILTSNGTTWTSAAPAASGGMTLLGTITATSGNSVSLGSLNLTNYKELRLVMQSVSVSAATFGPNMSSDNSYTTPISPWGYNGTASVARSGIATINLVNGAYSSSNGLNTDGENSYRYSGITNITTASTTIYLRLAGVVTYNGTGSFLVYGVA